MTPVLLRRKAATAMNEVCKLAQIPGGIKRAFDGDWLEDWQHLSVNSVMLIVHSTEVATILINGDVATVHIDVPELLANDTHLRDFEPEYHGFMPRIPDFAGDLAPYEFEIPLPTDPRWHQPFSPIQRRTTQRKPKTIRML